ncbi:MAG: hypothetical protein IKW30_09895 [Lachnospiraceae bacterium]|nr:hypothetical protein [Lachnospiraceae bacterium]
MKEILTIFRNYTGNGFLTILYILALLYLWMAEKNKTPRAIFVYGASVIQILFFIPLFYYGYQLLDEGTYYRILWVLPMTVTIAYTAVKILGRYPMGSIVIGLGVIMICGKYVYSNTYISKAENAYHIPQEVIEVCDFMMPEEGEERVKGVFPDELIHFVRQYSSDILMPYGRDYLAPDWIYGDHPLREVMNQEKIRISELVSLATEMECQYIIVERKKELIGNFDNYQVIRIGETENYDIYRNHRVDIEKK